MDAGENVKASVLIELLESYRFPGCPDERTLQQAVEEILVAGRVSFRREAVLARGERVDFLVGVGIGLELKTKGSTNDIARQVQRYCLCDGITEVVLATTRFTHAIALAEIGTFNGKPVHVARLKAGLL